MNGERFQCRRRMRSMKRRQGQTGRGAQAEDVLNERRRQRVLLLLLPLKSACLSGWLPCNFYNFVSWHFFSFHFIHLPFFSMEAPLDLLHLHFFLFCSFFFPLTSIQLCPAAVACFRINLLFHYQNSGGTKTENSILPFFCFFALHCHVANSLAVVFSVCPHLLLLPAR